MKIVPCFVIFMTAVSFHLHAQEIEWQQVLGGIKSEYLYDLKATPDYGYLLAGSSLSEDSGNKTEEGNGDLDYFLWKMDESGRMEWQKTFGGTGSDYLYTVGLTSDGGYILGGSSDSSVSGNKKDSCIGNTDFWIIKLNPEGEEEWQITLGGIGNDQLQSIQQTSDGGFIVGGNSDSSPVRDGNGKIIGNKSDISQGSFDYWVIKLSAQGEVEWERTLGGMFSDLLKTIVLTEEGYLVGGTSNSFASGNKTAENLGLNDYWVIQIDKEGEILWQKTFGGEGDESLAQIIPTKNGFLLAGSSNSTSLEGSVGASNGTDFWVMEIDKEGQPVWNNTYDFGKWDVLLSLVKADEDSYLLGGYASTENLGRKADSKGVNDYIALKIGSKGEVLWSRTIGGKGTDQLKGLVQTRDGNYILAGNSDSEKSGDKDKASIGGNDYWVVKLADKDKPKEKRLLIEVYPNPTYQYANLIISEDYTRAELSVFDMNGIKLQSKDLRYQSTPVDLQGYSPGVYIFKVIIDEKVTDVKVIKKGNK